MSILKSKGSGLFVEAYGPFCYNYTKYINTPTVSGGNSKVVNKITMVLRAKTWSVQQINLNAQYSLEHKKKLNYSGSSWPLKTKKPGSFETSVTTQRHSFTSQTT
jgi:hypothetical protein